jgi:hypothetical protein
VDDNVVLFVTNDARMSDGVLHDADRAALPQPTDPGVEVRIVSSSEALEHMKNRRPQDKPRADPNTIMMKNAIPLKPQDLDKLAQRWTPSAWEEVLERFTPMGRAHAAFVRHLRVHKRYTWRSVAAACHTSWRGFWSPPSNQLYGMAICEVAAKTFGEDFEEGDWN